MLWDAGQRGLCYHVDGVVRGRGTGDAKGTRLGEPLHITRRQIGHKLPDLSLENGHASHRFSANTSVTFTPSKLPSCTRVCIHVFPCATVPRQAYALHRLRRRFVHLLLAQTPRQQCAPRAMTRRWTYTSSPTPKSEPYKPSRACHFVC